MTVPGRAGSTGAEEEDVVGFMLLAVTLLGLELTRGVRWGCEA